MRVSGVNRWEKFGVVSGWSRLGLEHRIDSSVRKVVVLVMELQNPPLLELFFLESPGPVVIALLAWAAVLIITAFRRISVRHLVGGAGVAVVAAGVLLLATLVDTPREKLNDRASAIVRASMESPERLREFARPAARFGGGDGSVWMLLDTAILRFRNAQVSLGTMQHRVLEVQSQVDRQSFARTVLRLTTTVEQNQERSRYETLWLIIWVKDSRGEYHVEEVRWLQINDRAPSPMGW